MRDQPLFLCHATRLVQLVFVGGTGPTLGQTTNINMPNVSVPVDAWNLSYEAGRWPNVGS